MVFRRERAPASRKRLGDHAAWAMAVGGMIGGGIYTLAGIILGTAGPLAWVSLVLGGLLALATVQSYARLVAAVPSAPVPVTVLAIAGHLHAARILAWLLIAVYILALAVYTFTFGHYFARAVGLDARGLVIAQICAVGAIVALNARGVVVSARVQIVAVWIELAILAALAIYGFVQWSPENVTRGVPSASVLGVLAAMAGTFIAFEGFEMLAYDVRELRRPRKVMRSELPRAVIAVAIAYALVTVGAASLVGADVLVQHKESSLAVAGEAAAGHAGMIIVTIAACASAVSAINATLFSVARLARATAEQGLMPTWCGRCNRHDAPMWSIVAISAGALVGASLMDLSRLLHVASLGFLLLFGFVNVLAVLRTRGRHWASIAGAIGSAIAAVFAIAELLA